MSVLQLDGQNLTIEEVKDFLGNTDSQVAITNDAYQRVEASRKVVENIIDEEKTIYGIQQDLDSFVTY